MEGMAEYRFVRWPVQSTEQIQLAEKSANDLSADGWEMSYTTYIPAGQTLLTVWMRYKYRDEELEAAKHAALVEGAPMVDRHLAQFAAEEVNESERNQP